MAPGRLTSTGASRASSRPFGCRRFSSRGSPGDGRVLALSTGLLLAPFGRQPRPLERHRATADRLFRKSVRIHPLRKARRGAKRSFKSGGCNWRESAYRASPSNIGDPFWLCPGMPQILAVKAQKARLLGCGRASLTNRVLLAEPRAVQSSLRVHRDRRAPPPDRGFTISGRAVGDKGASRPR